MSEDLAWRVEAACHAAWPTEAEWPIGGWVVRAAGGPARRLNSVNPMRGGPRDPAPVLEMARARLAAVGKPLRVRVPSIATELNAALDELGFGPAEGETLTLIASAGADRTRGAVRLAERGDPNWLAARVVLAELDEEAAAQLRRTAEIVPAPARFASIESAGQPLAVGCGVLVDGLLVLEAINTSAAHRRQGHGRATVAALLGWGASAGAESACLQVQADNAPAIVLYRGVGFGWELYRYHYRTLA